MTAVANTRRVLDQANTVARYELLRFYSSYRLGGILALVAVWALVVVGLYATLQPLPAPGADVEVVKEASRDLARTYVRFVPLIAIGLAVLFGADSLVREFTSRTAHVVLPNPVSRSTVLGGKFLASAAASWFALFVYYLIAVAASWALFGMVAADVFSSYIYALLFTVGILAFAYVVSAVAPSVTAAVTAVFLLLAVVFPWVGEQLRGVEFWHLVIVTETGSLTVDLLSRTLPAQALIDAAVTVGLYIVIGLLVAAGAFIYREG